MIYQHIFSIIAPIFCCALIGFFWGRSRHPYPTDFVTTLVMNIGAPCLIVGTLSAVELDRGAFNQLLLATVMVMFITLLVSAAYCRLSGLSIRTYLPSLSFTNSGNIGLPLCMFAFGETGLALGLGIFLLMSLTYFSLGLALASGESLLRGMLRSPIVYAAIVSAALVYLQWQLPKWLGNTLELLGDVSIPLMLMTLGVSLARLKVADVGQSAKLSLVRLLLGVAVGLLVSELLALEGALRGVVIIQSAMPAAIFNYLLAQKYQRAPQAVAGLVVMSTLFSFVSLPALLWLVL